MTDLLDYPPTSSAPDLADYSRRRLSTRLALILGVAAIMIWREIFWVYSFPVSQHTLAIDFSVLLLLLLGLFTWRVKRTEPPIPSRFGFSGRLVILTIWIALMMALGGMRGNIPNVVFKEAVVFLMFAMWLFLGRYDSVWQAIRNPLLVVFYAGFVIILLTYRMPGVLTTFEGSTEFDIRGMPRNLSTVGYSCRFVMELGLLMGALGLVRRRYDGIKLLLLGGLAIYAAILIGMFEFRGSVVIVGVLLASYFLVLPTVRRELPIGTFIGLSLVAIASFVIFSRTQAYTDLMTRFAREQVFAHRFSESEAFFKDMNGLDLVVGRGMGGWYRGPYWAHGLFYNGEWQWSANHFGILGFVLRGGVLLLAFMASFVIPIFLPKPHGWYENEYNLAALVLAPVLIVNVLVNPILFLPDAFFNLLITGFCLARFSTPVMDPNLWPAPEHQE